MRLRSYWHLCVLIPALAGAACDEKLSDLAGPTPNLMPTFSSIQREIFNTQDRERTPRLHPVPRRRRPGGGTGLILTDGVSYGNLVGRASSLQPSSTRVIPGDADNSYLVRKLEGSVGHHRPPHAAQLGTVSDRRADGHHPPLDQRRRGQQLAAPSHIEVPTVTSILLRLSLAVLATTVLCSGGGRTAQ